MLANFDLQQINKPNNSDSDKKNRRDKYKKRNKKIIGQKIQNHPITLKQLETSEFIDDDKEEHKVVTELGNNLVSK